MSRADAIANTLLDLARIQGEGTRQAAAIRAQGQANQGQMWGQTLASIGQQVGQIPQQMQQQKIQDQEIKLRQQEMGIRQGQLKIQQDEQAGNAQLSQIIQGSMIDGPNGGKILDPQKATSLLSGANVPMDVRTKGLKYVSDLNGIFDGLQQHKIDLGAEAALHALQSGATPTSVQPVIELGRANGLISPEQADAFTQAVTSGADLKPLLKEIIGKSDKVAARYQGSLSADAKLQGELAQTAKTQAETAQIGKPKPITNEAELAADAANPQSPTQAQSAAAIATLQGPALTNAARAAAAQQETARHNRAEEAIGRARENRETAASSDDAKVIADAIINGDQPPTVAGLYRYAAPVKAELARKGYNLTTANLDWEATKKHLSTLNGAQQTRLRQAISTASDSLGVIEDLAKQWDGGKFPLLNKATLAAAKNGAMGPKAQQIATNLTAQITDVTSELGNVYMGGNSPTDHALQLAGANLSADWTRDQLLSAIKLARTNLNIRNNSIVNSVAITTAGPTTPAAAPNTTSAPAVKILSIVPVK